MLETHEGYTEGFSQGEGSEGNRFEKVPLSSHGILPLARIEGVMVNANGIVASLPGHGQPYSDCGATLVRGCLNVDGHRQQGLDVDLLGKVYVELYRRSCGRLECPICYEKAAGKEAHKISYRLGMVKRSFGLAIHVIVSPSKEDVANLSFQKLRPKAYRIALRAGFRGGSCIWHPFRRHPRKGWYFSPHFHMIGYGWIVWDKALFEATGWVVKNIGIRHSVEATAFYQISHCGVDKQKNESFDGRMVRATHSITWFGKLAFSTFHVPREPEPEHQCPICGQKLQFLTYRGRIALPDREGAYFLDSEGWELKGAWRFEGG